MEMPTAGTTAEAYLPKSAYSVSRVAADPKTKGLESGLEAVHTGIKTTLRERDDLEEQAQKEAALLDADDDACDDVVEEFELHLLGAVKKNRDNPKYKRYFGDGLRAVTTAEPREEEPKIVADILESMAEDENDPEIGAVVTQWKPKLTAARAKVIATVESLETTEKALANIKEKKLPALMAAWREEYKKLEGTLLTVYASNPKRVARFFKPFRKHRKVSKLQTPVVPPESP